MGDSTKKIALLLHPRLIEVEHYGVRTLVGVGNILHEIRVYGVAAVRTSRIIEIYDIEFRFYLVPVQVVQQVVVGNGREVCKLKIVDIHRVALLDLLLDVGIDHRVGFSAARRAQNDGRTLRQKNVDPAVIPPLIIVETGGQVHGVFIGQEPRFLHEGFVLVVEHIVHEVCLQQAARP